MCLVFVVKLFIEFSKRLAEETRNEDSSGTRQSLLISRIRSRKRVSYPFCRTGKSQFSVGQLIALD
jgi:hypothetical protein